MAYVCHVCQVRGVPPHRKADAADSERNLGSEIFNVVPGDMDRWTIAPLLWEAVLS